jgi:Repeat of unknown function (DUF5648)
MNRISKTSRLTRTAMSAATFAGLFLALSSAPALATDVRLVNYAAYTYEVNSADLMTDGVENLDGNSPTNALRLELWAFASPYVAGMSGVRLATYPLVALNAGEITERIDSGPVQFTRPSNGVWYFSMLLTEFTGALPGDNGYVARNWINFTSPEYIGVSPPPTTETAIEFYHSGFDHYFVAATAQDIFDLDTGVHSGWARTGYSFNVWNGPANDTNPVCRYYIPPGFGDSHFFSASPDECAIALVKFPWLVKETDTAFYIALPDTTTGACASDEVPVYRLWNGRTDSNHRYTTSTTVKAEMIAKGYVAEGYGPDQVDMCAAQ